MMAKVICLSRSHLKLASALLPTSEETFQLHIIILAGLYRVSQKIPQPENQNISEMHPIIFVLICLEDNCAKMCGFVLYLLDISQIDGNANFRN